MNETLSDMTAEVLEAIRTSFGIPVRVVRLLPSRLGRNAVVELGAEQALLKVVPRTSEDALARVRAFERQAVLLRELEDACGRRYLAHATTEKTVWLLERWVEGVTMWRRSGPLRSSPQDPEARLRFLQDIEKMVRIVMRVHDCGVLHGDLQPTHFIVDRTDAVHIVDFEVAVRIDEADGGYRGGLVHYASPETAHRLLRGGTDIPLDQSSEIYSLGVVLFVLYTGRTPAWYGMDPTDDGLEAPRHVRLQAIAEARVRTFADVGLPDFPELARILEGCLQGDPARRYGSFRELAQVVQATRSGFVS